MNRHIITTSFKLTDALEQLNLLSGGIMTLIVVDSESARMAGTLTDGDIRRALLRGVPLSATVDNAMNRCYMALQTTQTPIERLHTIRMARKRHIGLMPMLDIDNRIVNLVNISAQTSLLPLTAIVMAGGKGERLRPLTLTTPKPLLEIEGKAIIDYNIERLIAAGISDISVTVRYMADKIKAHFAEPIHGVKVKCIEETIPMGTIGAAALIKRPDQGCTLVMNSDLLTTINLEELYLQHIENNADITIAALPYTVSVPYAILTTAKDSNAVTSLQEKPTYSFMANAGIYIFNNALLNSLNPEERTDATTLIEAAMATDMKVIYYPINGTWIDIGSPADFNHARELMKHHRALVDSAEF